LAAYDTGRARVFGHCAASTGIEPFMALVEQVMTREPYASATRVFWIVDNDFTHLDQLRQRLADFQQRYNATARPWGGRSPQLTSTTCSTGSTSTSSRPPHRPRRRPHDQTPDELTGQTTKRGQRMGSRSSSHPGLPTPPRTAHNHAEEAA
jgi:hypothetical protein